MVSVCCCSSVSPFSSWNMTTRKQREQWNHGNVFRCKGHRMMLLTRKASANFQSSRLNSAVLFLPLGVMFVAEKPGSYKYEQQQSRNSCVEDVRDVEGIGVWEGYCEEESHWLLELWHICFVFDLVYEFCTQRCRRSNWIIKKKKIKQSKKIISMFKFPYSYN